MKLNDVVRTQVADELIHEEYIDAQYSKNSQLRSDSSTHSLKRG